MTTVSEGGLPRIYQEGLTSGILADLQPPRSDSGTVLNFNLGVSAHQLNI